MMFNFRRLGILCKCVLIIIKRLIVKKLKLIKKNRYEEIIVCDNC